MIPRNLHEMSSVDILGIKSRFKSDTCIHGATIRSGTRPIFMVKNVRTKCVKLFGSVRAASQKKVRREGSRPSCRRRYH